MLPFRKFQSHLTLRFCSGIEFDEDTLREVKRARKLAVFDFDLDAATQAKEKDDEYVSCEKELDQKEPAAAVDAGALKIKVPISMIACGGLHTVALTPSGVAYSWGCNDDGALGRDGEEWRPLPMDINQRCNGISVGDCHSTRMYGAAFFDHPNSDDNTNDDSNRPIIRFSFAKCNRSRSVLSH